MSRRDDERASAALLFDAELHAGTVTADACTHPAVRAAIRSRPVWSAPRRWVERKRYERGGRGYVDDSAQALHEARIAVLGAAAHGPPKVLVRVDEFPNYDALDVPEHGVAAYQRFHAVMRASGVPYLVAVQPALAHQPLNHRATGGRMLDADELAVLGRLASDGVTFGLHGFDHRTRTDHMPDNSELEGRTNAELAALIDRGLTFLGDHGVHPRVFVPPYNTFSARQWPVLAERFAVVTGGPESVGRMGYHRAPLFRDGAVYAPCYQPLYGRAHDVGPALTPLIADQMAIFITVTLHWEWELDDDFAALRSFLAMVAPVAEPWPNFLAAVERARHA